MGPGGWDCSPWATCRDMKTIDDLADTILLISYWVSFALNALPYSCCQIAPCQRVCFFLIVVWLLCYHYHRNNLIIQIVFEKSRRWFCKKTFWVEKGKLITEEKSFLIFQGCSNAGGSWLVGGKSESVIGGFTEIVFCHFCSQLWNCFFPKRLVTSLKRHITSLLENWDF